MRVLRAVGWLLFLLSIGGFVFSVFGIAGTFTMALLDTLTAAKLTRDAPWAMWAVAGAVIGIGPALWSVPWLNRRRLVVLAVPLGAVAVVGVVSAIVLR
jgi:hypothetical protein